jgi:hypothetical protein
MTSIEGIYPNRLKRRRPCAYLRIGRSIIYWEAKAKNLFEAAQEVYKWSIESRDVGRVKSSTWIEPVYKYLAGMATENLLKAIMIGNERAPVGEHELSPSLRSTTCGPVKKMVN